MLIGTGGNYKNTPTSDPTDHKINPLEAFARQAFLRLPFFRQKEQLRFETSEKKQDTLTYDSVIEYLVNNKPEGFEDLRGVILQEPIFGGKLRIVELFLDENDNIISKTDGTPYGCKIVVKNLDEELKEAFDGKNMIVVS